MASLLKPMFTIESEKEETDMTDSTVPTFSLAELRNSQRREEFRRCVTEKGVFYLTGSGLSEADQQSARDVAVDFFQNRSAEEKKGVSAPDSRIRRGFTRLELESTAKITDSGRYSDYSMSYSTGRTDNLFPSAEFQGKWEEYFQRMKGTAQDVAREVLRVVGGSMGSVLLERSDPLLRLRYYPEVPEGRVAKEEPATKRHLIIEWWHLDVASGKGAAGRRACSFCDRTKGMSSL